VGDGGRGGWGEGQRGRGAEGQRGRGAEGQRGRGAEGKIPLKSFPAQAAPPCPPLPLPPLLKKAPPAPYPTPTESASKAVVMRRRTTLSVSWAKACSRATRASGVAISARETTAA
jgi:hypothetical protein